MTLRRAVLGAVGSIFEGDSMRAPMEEGLARMGHAQGAYRASKVSRALWPTARRTFSQALSHAALAALEPRGPDVPVLQRQIRKSRVQKQQPRPPGARFPPGWIFTTAGQPVRTVVGLARLRDFLRRAVLIKRRQYESATGIRDAGGQLAIGKTRPRRPRQTALPVGGLVQRPRRARRRPRPPRAGPRAGPAPPPPAARPPAPA